MKSEVESSGFATNIIQNTTIVLPTVENMGLASRWSFVAVQSRQKNSLKIDAYNQAQAITLVYFNI